MKDVNLNADDEGSVKDVTDDEGSVQRLIDPAYDPVYGPTSKHFWPGSYLYARSYILSPTHLPTYVSGKKFLEMYDDQFSGISDYLASTDYPDESYCDTLRDHFHSLYDDVESWDTATLFVSAVYRDLFDEIRPYQSQLLELRTRLNYESIWENYLKEGRKDEALAVYGSYVRKGDKREGNLCISTCLRLLTLILDPYTDLLLISEMIKVLHRTSIVATHQKELQEGLLLELESTDPLPFLVEESRRNVYRERFVLVLSLLQIESETAQKAVDDAFSSLTYEPIISLIRDHPSKSGFVSDEAQAYYLAPNFTAADYIRDLVLSEEAYDRIFEEVRDSAADWKVSSVLMSFEEEAGKLGQLACLDMLRELYTDQEDTPLLSIIDSAAKSFDEDDLIATDEVSVNKILDKISEKITVPFQARKRILKICERHGIPDNEALAKRIISEASSTTKFNQDEEGNAREKLVKEIVIAFGHLIVLALVIVLRAQRTDNAMLLGPNAPTTAMHEKQTVGTRLDVNETRDGRYLGLRGGFRGGGEAEPTNIGRGLSGVASRNLVQFKKSLPRQQTLKIQRPTNRTLQQPKVISAYKKGVGSAGQTLLGTAKDREKYADSIHLRETFDLTTNQVSIEGSSGSIHSLRRLQNNLLKTVAKNLSLKVLPSDLDHPLPSRFREGLSVLHLPKDDTNYAEAIFDKIHAVLTAAGKATYTIVADTIVTRAGFLDQVHGERVKIFNSLEVKDIMANQLNGRITPKDYERCSERGLVWNTELVNRVATVRGLRADCVKSLVYPTQISNDCIRHVESVTTRFVSLQNLAFRGDLQKQKEMQALLNYGQSYVSTRLSILAKFRDSGSYSQTDTLLERMIERVVHDYNKLSDLGNDLYSMSKATGSPLAVPRFGKIRLTTTSSAAIRMADRAGFNDQWGSRGAVPIGDTLETEQSKTDFYKLLTPNGLKNDPGLFGVETYVHK